MPQPTREQFEAAAKRVSAAGLSREQFFAAVDQELARVQPDADGFVPFNTVSEQEKQQRGMTAPEKPGFFEAIDQAAGRMAQNPMLKSMAQPKNSLDLIGLVTAGSPVVPQKVAPLLAAPTQGAGRILESIGASRPARALERFGPLGGVMTGSLKGAAASIIPGMARGAGRTLQRVGKAMEAEPIIPAKMGEVVEEGAPYFKEAEYEAVPRTEIGAGSSRPALSGATPAQPKLKSGTIEAPESPMDLRKQLHAMADEVHPPDPHSMGGVNDGRTPPPDVARQPGPAPETMVEEMHEGMTAPDTQPLGMPRVMSWKEGKGPTAADIGKARDYGGAKDAAHRLQIPVKRVQAEAPRMSPRSLPPEAQNRIRAEFERMSPEDKLTYLASAPNGITANFIQALMGK